MIDDPAPEDSSGTQGQLFRVDLTKGLLEQFSHRVSVGNCKKGTGAVLDIVGQFGASKEQFVE